jgi:putative MATE family efflux protein
MSTNKQFYKTMIHIGLPIAISHLMTSSLNLVDTFMIGGVGEDAIAAVGVANRLFFLFSLSMYGIYSGCGIFTAQYWGKKDLVNIHRVMGIMLFFGSIVGVLFTLGGLLIPEVLMRIFTRETVVVALGAQYLRIVAFSYMMTTVSFMYSFTSRSVHKTFLPMLISGFSIALNTLLNYFLIYGTFGFPRLGVQGAAIATLAARTFELIVLIVVIYSFKEHPLKASFKTMFSFDGELVRRVILRGYPVFINEATWALGNTVYFMAYGLLGTSALAVVQIAYTVSDLFQSLFMGIGSACGVMVGNDIGKGDIDKAFADAKRFLKLTVVLSLTIVVGIIATRHMVAGLYKSLTPQTTALLLKTLIVTAVYQLPKMFTFTMIVGILRSGGDTHYCMVLDLMTVWLVGVPLGFISVLVFKLPVYWVVAFVFFEEWVKVFVTYPRFISRKWINKVV